MNVTPFEKGIAVGAEKGRRELTVELLKDRFGALPQCALERLTAMNMEQLKELQKASLRANSLRELGLED